MVLLHNKASKVLKTKDFSKLFLWSAKYILDICIMWPYEKTQLRKTISFIIHAAALIFVISGLLLYAHKNSHDFNKVTFALCTLSLPLFCLYTVFFIWYKYEDLATLVDYIFERFWPYDIIEARNIDYVVKSFKYQSMFMVLFFSVGAVYEFVGCTVPLIQTERTLIFYCGYPFDWTVSPIYECIYVIQVFILVCSIPMIIGGVDFFVLGMLLGSSYQYCILQHCFSVFNTNKMDAVNQKMRKVFCDQLEDEYDDKKEFFVRLVRHHHMLLSCAVCINNVFSLLELGHLFFSIYAICFGLFRFTILINPSVADVIIFLMSILGFLMQLSIDCFLGTFLYYQASLLPSAIFESNWINLENKELKKDIVFMIQHSQRIPQFSAFNLYDLNTMSFGKVLKLTFSMYTVLSSLGQ